MKFTFTYINLFFLIYLFIYQTSFAKKNELYITLDPNECTSCLQALKNIEYLSPNIKYSFVFKEKYKTDSSLLIEQLLLKKYKDNYIWSDSVYSLFSLNGLSSVVLIADSSSNMQIRLLKSLDKNYIDYINFSIEEQGSITTLSEPLFLNDVIPFFTIQNEKYYFRYNLRKSIKVYSKKENNLILSYELTESIIRAAFNRYFPGNKDSAYSTNVKYYRDLQIPNPNKLEGHFVNGDSLYVINSHQYVFFNERRDSSFINTFYSFFKVVNKKVDKYAIIDIDSIYSNDGNLLLLNQFTERLNNLYFSMTKKNNIKSSAHNYLFAKLSLNEDKVYRLNKYLKFELPVAFETYFGSHSIFFDNYALSVYGDIIYNLIDDKKMVSISRFNNSKETINPKNQDFYNYSFKINDKFIWLLRFYGDDKKVHFQKFEINGKLLEDISLDIDYKNNPFNIDDEDYNCIQILMDDRTIMKRKIFNN